MSKEQQADAIKLLECALARAKNGFRLSPKLVEALKEDNENYAKEHSQGALINTIHRHARAGATMTVPWCAEDRSHPEKWRGTAAASVAERLRMLPQTVSRQYEKAMQKFKPPKQKKPSV